MTQHAERSVGHETRDVTARAVILSGIGFVCGTALCALLITGLMKTLPVPSRLDKPPIERIAQDPPPPRLEIDGRRNRAAVEGAAAARLKGYAWVDRSAGTARIPIRRAMELTVQQGWGTQ